MLFRVTPPSRLDWINFPMNDDIRRAVIENGTDLDQLDGWQSTTELQFSDTVLAIALRHGIATGSGIAVRATHLVELTVPRQLRESMTGIEAGESDLRKQHGDLLEALLPGWTAYSDELLNDVRAGNEEAILSAQEDIATELATPVISELAEHWQRRGGRLPAEG